MTDSVTFSRTFISQINATINALEALRVMRDRLVQESTLSQTSADAMNASGRPDLSKTDFDNASSAIQQIMFTFDSGAPTQKSYLYKML